MVRCGSTVLEKCFSVSVLLNYCSDDIAADEEEKMNYFFIETVWQFP